MTTTDDWEPPPGTTKKLCRSCQKVFASRGTSICPTCAVPSSNKAYKRQGSDSPFSPVSTGRRVAPKGIGGG